MGNPIRDMKELSQLFKEMLEGYAKNYLEAFLNKGIELDCAVEIYLHVVQNSGEYEVWQECYEEMVGDCIHDYGMDKWFAESLLGINLNKEIINGLKLAWTKYQGQRLYRRI